MGLSGNPAEMNGRNLKFQSLAPVCPLHLMPLSETKSSGPLILRGCPAV